VCGWAVGGCGWESSEMMIEVHGRCVVGLVLGGSELCSLLIAQRVVMGCVCT